MYSHEFDLRHPRISVCVSLVTKREMDRLRRRASALVRSRNNYGTTVVHHTSNEIHGYYHRQVLEL